MADTVGIGHRARGLRHRIENPGQVLARFPFDRCGDAAVVTTWITQADAAKIVGCSGKVIEHAVAMERVAHRPRYGGRPSVDRASVETFAQLWQADQARLQERRAERQRRDAERIGPPTTDEVWLDCATAALLLGWTTQYVARLAAHDRLPNVRRGQRWWFRRPDVERYAAARAFAHRFSAA